jgi:DNA protecting protein DprA
MNPIAACGRALQPEPPGDPGIWRGPPLACRPHRPGRARRPRPGRPAPGPQSRPGPRLDPGRRHQRRTPGRSAVGCIAARAGPLARPAPRLPPRGRHPRPRPCRHPPDLPRRPGWPPALDDLGPARPHALWTRGPADLAACFSRSAAIVGAQAATAHGQHTAADVAASLADQGWTIISGAAYGIDAAAHRGALDAGGITIAVLACGPDIPYPRAHRSLLDDISARGAIISEWPPGTPPGRSRFLLRNRVIAALARGTVVAEASVRSGTLATAHHATALGRPLMAVPGPVTSAVSAGCHTLIRDRRAVCVTSAADITAHLLPTLP